MVCEIQNYIHVGNQQFSPLRAADKVCWFNFLSGMALRVSKKNAARSAFSLASPRGEFSIVIVKVGVDLGVVSSYLFPLIGVITIITTFLTPLLIRVGDLAVKRMEPKNAT